MFITLGVLLQVVRKHKRSKALTALFLPAIIIIFLIGWSLSCIGTKQQPRKPLVKPAREKVHLRAITLEEPTEIPN